MVVEGKTNAATGRIQWVSTALDLPDPDFDTIIALDDGEVTGGFWDGDLWRYACAARIEDRKVTAWADYPDPPPAEEL